MMKMRSRRRLRRKRGAVGLLAAGRNATSNGVTSAMNKRAIVVIASHHGMNRECRGSTITQRRFGRATGRLGTGADEAGAPQDSGNIASDDTWPCSSSLSRFTLHSMAAQSELQCTFRTCAAFRAASASDLVDPSTALCATGAVAATAAAAMVAIPQARDVQRNGGAVHRSPWCRGVDSRAQSTCMHCKKMVYAQIQIGRQCNSGRLHANHCPSGVTPERRRGWREENSVPSAQRECHERTTTVPQTGTVGP